MLDKARQIDCIALLVRGQRFMENQHKAVKEPNTSRIVLSMTTSLYNANVESM